MSVRKWKSLTKVERQRIMAHTREPLSLSLASELAQAFSKMPGITECRINGTQVLPRVRAFGRGTRTIHRSRTIVSRNILASIESPSFAGTVSAPRLIGGELVTPTKQLPPTRYKLVRWDRATHKVIEATL